ncbi:MAG: hypothetical protein ABFR53_09820 [Actinomycetota bacterium]
MQKLIAALLVGVLLLTACSVDPEEGTTTSRTPSTTAAETQDDDVAVGENDNTSDPVESGLPAESSTTTSGEANASTTTGPGSDDPGVTSTLPEPGGGLEVPKTPTTTLITPPPQD